MADLSFSITEDITTSESTGPSEMFNPSTNDISATSESLGYYPEDVTVGETIFLTLQAYISVNKVENVAVNENVGLEGHPSPMLTDAVLVNELLGYYPDSVFAQENVAIVILNPFDTQISDGVSTSEDMTVLVPSGFNNVNPKKIIAEETDPITINIQTRVL